MYPACETDLQGLQSLKKLSVNKSWIIPGYKEEEFNGVAMTPIYQQVAECHMVVKSQWLENHECESLWSFQRRLIHSKFVCKLACGEIPQTQIPGYGWDDLPRVARGQMSNTNALKVAYENVLVSEMYRKINNKILDSPKWTGERLKGWRAHENKYCGCICVLVCVLYMV